MSAARLAELLESWGYAAYLLLLGITGAGSPIPEDLILATAGYMISAGIFSWPGRMPFGRFLLLDAAGAVLWVPAVLLLGARIGEEIGGLDRLVASAGRSAVWAGVTILILVLAWSLWRAEESKL